MRLLGFSGVRDDDVISDTTLSLVEAFQRSRGLIISGTVDATTWLRLEEAGWRLGDRLLYLTRPYLRGDDVADLQVRLSQLGFDPGRIDGVFGPLLHDAVLEFQTNCGITADGTLTRRTLLELLRVTPTVGERTLVTELRDGATKIIKDGPLVVWGQGPLHDAIVSCLPASLVERPPAEATIELVAAMANNQGAAGVLVVLPTETVDGLQLHYWASYRSHSRQGERLASLVAASLTALSDAPRLSVTGMSLPILRETKMTTLHITHGSLEDADYPSYARAIGHTVSEFFHS